MAFEKLEKKVNQISKKIKQGRFSQEIGDEISSVINEIEDLGGEAKEKFKDAILIFLTPPNIMELRKRIEKRATETKEKIDMRMKRAKEEIKLINKYDYIVINNFVSEAVLDIDNIVNTEKKAAKRHIDLIDIFLKGVQ